MSEALNRKNCNFCKKPIKKESEICFDCKVMKQNKISNKNKILSLSLLFCMFFGFLGIYRFYLFSPKSGLTFLFISILFFLISTLIQIK
ncbi:TM2 domain-containing protein (plasmid) [Borreliella americana]